MAPPLDTNVVIREITRDDPRLSAGAHAFLRELAAGTAEAQLTEAVLLECAQVLGSKTLYSLPRAEIAHDLAVIIRLRGVRLANKRRYLRALTVYATVPALSFTDALLVAYAEQDSTHTLVSFDRGFDRVPGITRREPSLPAS